MGKLTTHVLDTAMGRPAAGLEISLRRLPGGEEMAAATTNLDGRLDAPLLEGDQFAFAEYELIFRAGEYLASNHPPVDIPAFLGDIPIRFVIAEDSHYHVPLLLSPFGYSTYRGS
jgi:5-hydroxyisourate hydrolase